MQTTEKKINGALVGLFVIIIILIIGGIYIWQTKAKEMETLKAQNAAAIIEQNNIINKLEQDIKNTDTNVGVDAKTIN